MFRILLAAVTMFCLFSSASLAQEDLMNSWPEFTPYDNSQADESATEWEFSLENVRYQGMIAPKRFLSVDRFADKYPSMTPYHYTANNPILFIDINGDSTYIVAYGAGHLNTNLRGGAHDVGSGFQQSAEALAEQIRNRETFDPKRDAVIVVDASSTEKFTDAVNKNYDSGKIASLTVFSHGYSGGISLGGEIGNTAQFNDYDLREINSNTVGQLDNTNFESGASCTLNGCNIGSGGTNSFAQTMADHLNVTVRAFDNYSEFRTKNGDGRTVIYDGTMIRSVDRRSQQPIYTIFNPGRP